MIFREGLPPVLIGIILGLIGAGFIAHFLASQLYHISSVDPATYLSTAGALVVVCAIATAIPAVRASNVNPANSLKAE
jgi:ABC-type antimicrobial peptide transport system permease subunit